MDTVDNVTESRMLSRLQLDNTAYLLHCVVLGQKNTFSHRFLSIKCTNESLRKSFGNPFYYMYVHIHQTIVTDHYYYLFLYKNVVCGTGALSIFVFV